MSIPLRQPAWLLFAICHFGIFLIPGQAAQETFGVVRDFAGTGINNVLVRADVFDPTNSYQFATNTDAQGQFSFAGPAGNWSISVDSFQLNSRGYLDITPASFELNDGARFAELTTRRLELQHRLSGHLQDELGSPLGASTVRAEIVENGQVFSTNAVTGTDGSFEFRLSPAIWQIQAPNIFALPMALFPELDVAIERTNSDTELTIVAPRITSSLTGVATNLRGYEIVAQCQAFGYRYVQSTRLFDNASAFALPVFNGVWTIFVTNRYPGFVVSHLAPPPIVVAVTNATTNLQFAGLSPLPRQTLEVRVTTPGGTPVTNVFVFASKDDNRGYEVGTPPLPLPFPSDPTIHRLQLAPGRWSVTATVTHPEGTTWQAAGRVLMPSDSGTNMSLVLPENGGAPRILATVRDADGAPLGGRQIIASSGDADQGYRAFGTTGLDGSFELSVMPGTWLLTVPDLYLCTVSATVSVTNTDEHVELQTCSSPLGPLRPLMVQVVADTGLPGVAEINFSGWAGYYHTNTSAGPAVVAPLSEGIWHVSVDRDWAYFQTDVYRLWPSLRIQHDGAVTNVSLVSRMASARIEGRLRDGQGRLLNVGYVSARMRMNGTNYFQSAQIYSGYFSIPVVPGEWEVAVSPWRYPNLVQSDLVAASPRGGAAVVATYTEPEPQILQVTNGLVTCEFVTRPLQPPVPLTVALVREDGSALGNATVTLNGTVALDSQITDANGLVTFLVPPGTVQLAAFREQPVSDPGGTSLFFPSVSLELSGASNRVVLVARKATDCVSGSLKNAAGKAIPVAVNGTIRVNGTNYNSSACPDPTAAFCLPVFPGQWDIAIGDQPINDLGYASLPRRVVEVTATGAVPEVHFVLQPFSGDFRESHWLAPERTADGQIQLELRGKTASTWRIEVSTDFSVWEFLSTVTTRHGAVRFSDPSASGASRFYRAVWVE